MATAVLQSLYAVQHGQIGKPSPNSIRWWNKKTSRANTMLQHSHRAPTRTSLSRAQNVKLSRSKCLVWRAPHQSWISVCSGEHIFNLSVPCQYGKKSGLCRPFLLCQNSCSGDLNAARQLQHNTLNLFLFQIKYISIPKPCLAKGFHFLLQGTKQPQHKQQVHQFCSQLSILFSSHIDL